MDKKYIDYLFEDLYSGELFFVEVVKDSNKNYTACYNEAWAVAEANFDAPRLIRRVSPEIAETYGYDTY